MSKMSDLSLQIQDMLEDNEHPTHIARQLGIPLGMVYDVLESMSSEEELSPFETINS
jgi:hypothetical protein